MTSTQDYTPEHLVAALDAHRQTYTDNLNAALANQKQALIDDNMRTAGFWANAIVEARHRLASLDSLVTYAVELAGA